MEITTYDMERRAVMPTAAPVGAVAPGYTLAAANPLQVHGTFAPIAPYRMGISVKPWTNRYDRQIGQEMTSRSARHLGRTST